MYTTVSELQQAVGRVFRLDENTPHILDEQMLRETIIDPLVFTAVFASDPELKAHAGLVIRQLAAGSGVHASSIHNYYLIPQSAMCVPPQYHSPVSLAHLKA